MLPKTIEAIYSPTGLKLALEAAGLRMTKALGQNFLANKKMIEAMLSRTQLPTQGAVIEIGPGLGHLTWALLERGLDVTAIELDRTMARALRSMNVERMALDPGQPALTIIEADAKEADYLSILNETNAEYAIGNLPYNVSVPILFRLAYCGAKLKGIYATIQKEVGERILAEPGSKAYGRLSIVLNCLCETRKLHTLGPKAFFPAPKVDSIMIGLSPKPDADLELAELYLERVVKLGFAHRRKKIRSQLKQAIIQRRVFDEPFMAQLENEFDLDSRAEQWPLDEWIRLAQWVREQPQRE